MTGHRNRAVRGPLRTVLTIAAVACSGAFVAACGSSNDSTAPKGDSAANTSNGAASAGHQEVKNLAAELLKRPTSVGVTEPVGKPIPSGKQLVWISCGVPACLTLGKTFVEGAKELGWSARIVNTDGTPEKVKAAWTQATVSKPDAVASSGTDLSLIGPQLQKLKAADIPVALYAVPQRADGVTVLVGDMKGEGESYGEPMAAWISNDSAGKANTLLVTIPNFPILKGLTDGFQAVYDKGCSGCKFKTLDLPLSALGKDVPQRVVSALRADPSINYVAMAVDDLTAGLPAALRAAGLADKVKIIGATSGTTNYQYISAGQQAAGVPNAFFEDTWLMIDGLARHFTGQDVSVSEVTPPRMVITKQNLPSNTELFPLVPDYKSQFLKLWGKA